jgi:hypothetical protein
MQRPNASRKLSVTRFPRTPATHQIQSTYQTPKNRTHLHSCVTQISNVPATPFIQTTYPGAKSNSTLRASVTRAPLPRNPAPNTSTTPTWGRAYHEANVIIEFKTQRYRIIHG